MQHKSSVLVIDPTLTPANAKERGYEYIDDIVYDASLPRREIVELIKEYDHMIGQPSERNSFKNYFGIYAPIESKKK